VSYDGTDYCGWQRQSPEGNNSQSQIEEKITDRKAVPTIQEELEKALQKLHKVYVPVAGSGRTDSGVHALSQAATFVSPIDSIPVKNYVPAINSFLPQDIRVMDAEEKPEGFHARFSAKRRTYRYFLDPSSYPAANDKRFSWSLYRMPDVNTLNEMAGLLRGEIDFTTFCSAKDKSESRFRFIYNAEFFLVKDVFQKEKICFEISANAFLWNMVRSLVGTFVEFEKKGYGKKEFSEALISGDRSKAGITAPPNGLFLYKIDF
jgi:tRNA pseudouridine38-40 synthase